VTSGAFIGALGIWQGLGHHVPSWLYWAIGIVGLLVASYLAWSAQYDAWKRAEQANGSKPLIDVEVKEALIAAVHGKADCFVHASLHNRVREAPTNIGGYRLTLTIGGKPYTSDRLVALDGYGVGFWEPDADNPEPWNNWRRLDKELTADELPSKLVDPVLTLGNRKDGWLRFQVERVPKWPTYEEPTGQRIEYYDQETGEHRWDDEMSTVYDTSNVQSVELAVQDAFNHWHTGRLKRPLCRDERAILEPELVTRRKEGK
jgi:hypothetical protein